MARLPAAERRKQLLDCALVLFSEQGYARATTAQLAKAAGVTEPIIYRHFPSKKALFIALIERTGDETLSRWKADLAGAGDPAERLHRLIGDNPMVTPRGLSGYRVFLQAITETGDEEIREALNRHIEKLHTFMCRELAEAQDKHRVTSRYSAEVLAWLLINIGLGYGVLTAMAIHGHGRDGGGTHIQDVLRRVLIARGEGRGEGRAEASGGELPGS